MDLQAAIRLRGDVEGYLKALEQARAASLRTYGELRSGIGDAKTAWKEAEAKVKDLAKALANVDAPTKSQAAELDRAAAAARRLKGAYTDVRDAASRAQQDLRNNAAQIAVAQDAVRQSAAINAARRAEAAEAERLAGIVVRTRAEMTRAAQVQLAAERTAAAEAEAALRRQSEAQAAAAAWLRQLIADGHIPPGDVDERSITDVDPTELAGYRQLHFFAGIGGWPLAARLAGWPDDRELVTGSCPCQPFSVAGKGAGTADARHLWPDFFRIIRARRPAVVMGEQVAAAVGKGWFLGVRSDLESIGYDARGIVVPASAVNAPHRRDRLWFVAGRIVLEHTESIGRGEGRPESSVWSGRAATAGAGISHSHVANSDSSGRGAGIDYTAAGHGHSIAATSRPGAWDSASWLIGHDGKARRVEPSIPLLVDGLPNRVGLLRGFGNAIVPQIAAEMMAAWMEEYPL